MLVVRKIGVGQADYFLDGRALGYWTGTGCGALNLAGKVDRAAFVEVLSGCGPGGRHLLRRNSPGHRAGFDLVFAAPKSVSLLAGLTDGLGPERAAAGDNCGATPLGPTIVGAHDAAVADTLAYLERRACWTRRGAAHKRVPVSGLVAAGFRHGFSWSDDPHLHTHVVVANIVLGDDGTWSCLDSRSIYNHRQAASAVYQASLRHQLDQARFRLAWTVRPDGLADIAGVPRTAIEACSTRRRAILDAGDGLMPMTAAARAVAAGRTRRLHDAPIEHWETRAAAVGLDRQIAAGLLAPRRENSPVGIEIPGDVATVVDGRISATMASFAHSDCVRLAAAQLPSGATAEALETWASQFVERAIPTDNGRWVTPTLRTRQIQVAVLAARPPARSGLARPESVADALSGRPGLGPAARLAVERLTSSGAGVERLGYGSFLVQAAVLEAAQEAWEASGHRVSVIAANERAESRWRALCGLGPPPALPHHASVVIVDNADRMCTAELHRIIADGASRGAKVVLVEGGTGPAPRGNVGPAFAELRAAIPALEPGSVVVPVREAAPVRGGLNRTVSVLPRSHDAFNALVADWAEARAGPHPAVMVALGPEEAGALNTLARQVLIAEGVLHGPAVTVDGHEWRAGDELRVLRRHPLLGPATAGTLGRVTAVDPAAASVTVGWPAGPMTMAATDLRRAPATYAYATTPSYLRHWRSGSVLSLGDLGSRRPARLEQPNLYLVAHPMTSRDMALGPVARMVNELAANRAAGGGNSLGETRAIRPLDGGATNAAIAEAPPLDSDRYHPWSLRQLADFRADLGDRLSAAAPPDVGPEQRRLVDELAWQQARGGRTDVLDERGRVLAAASDVRRQWLEDHAVELSEWVNLGKAMSHRADLLAVASEARPSRVVQAEIGPRPEGEHDRGEWQRAALAIESYRDRWDVADDPDALHLSAQSDGIDPARQNDLVRAVAATRSVGRGQGLSRGPPPARHSPRASSPHIAISDRLVATRSRRNRRRVRPDRRRSGPPAGRPQRGPHEWPACTSMGKCRRRIAYFRWVWRWVSCFGDNQAAP
jgi:conjugative relaxase-like TrwC/TraI family protein